MERVTVQKIVTPLLLASVLAACAPTVPAVMPAAPQAAPAQAVAPATKPAATTVTVAKTPAVTAPKATQPAVTTPVKAAMTATQPVKAAPAPVTKTVTDWADVDLSAAFASLTGATPTGPDEADDDSDLQESSFSTKFWFGWWGIDGLQRALRTFSNEEGRPVTWRPLPSGWVGMTAALSGSEIIEAIALAINPLYTRTPTSYWNLPSTFRKHTTRHLKIYRRQGVVDLQSKQIAYYQVSMMFMGGIYGYIARAENGPERYVAYYDGSGRLMASFGTKAATGGGVPDVGIFSTP